MGYKADVSSVSPSSERMLSFNICFIISSKQRKPFVFVALASIDNKKFLSLFLLGFHIKRGVTFLKPTWHVLFVHLRFRLNEGDETLNYFFEFLSFVQM